MKAAQVIIVVMLFAGFLLNLYTDFNDRPARAANGYRGAVVSFVILVTGLWVAYKAGAMSTLVGQ